MASTLSGASRPWRPSIGGVVEHKARGGKSQTGGHSLYEDRVRLVLPFLRALEDLFNRAGNGGHPAAQEQLKNLQLHLRGLSSHLRCSTDRHHSHLGSAQQFRDRPAIVRHQPVGIVQQPHAHTEK